MAVAAPLVLGELLRASDLVEREAAWEELISRHTRLLLTVARSFRGSHDDVMERYSYILGKLRESDFRRLRTFDPNLGASFSTWIVVSSRRLCLDYHRALYGRQRTTVSTDRSDESRTFRRSLADSISAEIDVDMLADSTAVAADSRAIIAERNALLRAELTKLTPRERLLLALRFQDDLSASRIARIVGMPTAFHVYRQLNSILAGLRRRLIASGVDGVTG
jgi:RNA polymerase sigma factor (sigma-70 family)